jgi:hypothetical protein
MPENDNPPKGFLAFLKDYLALAIAVFSFVVLILLLINAFSKISDPATFSNTKDIIGLFLPIIGTWMGTILAFYFSKDNFESANRSMQQTIKSLTSEEKLKTTKADSVMIPVNAIEHPFNGTKTADTITITEMLQFLDKIKRNRIVVIDENKIVSKVIHRSAINSFISHQVLADKDPVEVAVVQKLKIEDMETLGTDDVKDVLKNGVEFIAQDASLFDAQQKMIKNKKCQDVFITNTGSRTEAVIGWITSVIVTDNAKV